MKVGGIVLCGGKSSRMGWPKATLPFGPELMIQRVLRLLGQVVEPLVVVAAPDQQLPELPKDVLVARDQRKDRGPLEGISAGLRAISRNAEAAYVTSCDVPLLVPQFVEQMIQFLGMHQIAVPIDGDLHHPLAAVYRTVVVSSIRSLLEAERLRPVYLFDEVDTCRVQVEQLMMVDPQLHTLENLNRPADYIEALSIAGFEVPSEIADQLGNPPES